MQGQDYLMQPLIPRRIEDNPSLADGQYDALVRDISLRRSTRDTQFLLLFYFIIKLSILLWIGKWLFGGSDGDC